MPSRHPCSFLRPAAHFDGSHTASRVTPWAAGLQIQPTKMQAMQLSLSLPSNTERASRQAGTGVSKGLAQA